MPTTPASIKVTVELELTRQEYIYLCNHSIERAINLSIDAAEESKHKEFQTVVDDMTDIKPIATKLWTTTHNAIFAHLNK